MKVRSISYNSTHIPEIRKFILWIGLCAVFVLLVGTIQTYILINANKNGVNLTTAELVSSFFCLIISLVFVLFMAEEIARHLVLIKRINANGFVESKTLSFDYSKKLSFGNFFRLFEYVLLTLTVILVVAFTTSCVLDYLYYTTINYYVPIVLMVLVTTFYSTKMLEFRYAIEKS